MTRAPITSAGGSWEWSRIRVGILARDEYRCHWCGRWASHVDHLIPRKLGGDEDPSNLVASCAPCNLNRGATLGPPGTPRRPTAPPSRNW